MVTREEKSVNIRAIVLTLCFAFSAVRTAADGIDLQLENPMLMFDAPSTRLFLGWQSAANTLLQAGLVGVSDMIHVNPAADGLLRAATLALFTGAGLIVNQAFSLTAHDQSHMEAARAIGATNIGLVRSSGQSMSLWQFFWEAFNFTAEPGLYTYYKVSPSLTELAYVSGEGLDTNMLIADMISRKINGGSGGITDLAPYMLNKVWGINYFLVSGSTSDSENYMIQVNGQGHGRLDRETIIGLHAASLLLSGGFLSLAKGTWEYIFLGESSLTPLQVPVGDLRLFWPEVTTWLNPDNVSLQVMFSAAWKDFLSVRAGLDTAVLGQTAANPEATLGVEAAAGRFTIGAEVTTRFARLPFMLASLRFSASNSVSLGIEGYYGEKNTMRELREFPLGPGAVGYVKVRL
jgi:hypothetical protein